MPKQSAAGLSGWPRSGSATIERDAHVENGQQIILSAEEVNLTRKEAVNTTNEAIQAPLERSHPLEEERSVIAIPAAKSAPAEQHRLQLGAANQEPIGTNEKQPRSEKHHDTQFENASNSNMESSDIRASGPGSTAAEPNEHEVERDSKDHPELDQQISCSTFNSKGLSTGMTKVSVTKNQSIAATVTVAAEEEDSEDEPEYLGNIMISLITTGLILATFIAALNGSILGRFSCTIILSS